MDDFERRSLFNCRQHFYDNVDVDVLMAKLHKNGILSESRRREIEKCSTKKERMAKLLHYLSFKDEDCFELSVHSVKEDYPELACKIKRELLKERASFSKDINDGLIEMINQQLLPIVYGKGPDNRKSDVNLTSERPQVSITKLSELITHLRLRCLRILGVKPSEAKHTSLPVLINKRIKQQQETVRQLKADIQEIKDLPKKNRLLDGKEEITPSEKVFLLRKDLQEQHERVRQLRLSLHSRERKAIELKRENAKIQQEIQQFKKEGLQGNMEVGLLFDDDL